MAVLLLFSGRDLLGDPFLISEDYMENIEDAIDIVQETIDSIDRVQSLFPSQKCAAKDYDVCSSVCFRVSLLNNAVAGLCNCTLDTGNS